MAEQPNQGYIATGPSDVDIAHIAGKRAEQPEPTMAEEREKFLRSVTQRERTTTTPEDYWFTQTCRRLIADVDRLTRTCRHLIADVDRLELELAQAREERRREDEGEESAMTADSIEAAFGKLDNVPLYVGECDPDQHIHDDYIRLGTAKAICIEAMLAVLDEAHDELCCGGELVACPRPEDERRLRQRIEALREAR